VEASNALRMRMGVFLCSVSLVSSLIEAWPVPVLPERLFLSDRLPA
jgi:hypothetical protein